MRRLVPVLLPLLLTGCPPTVPPAPPGGASAPTTAASTTPSSTPEAEAADGPRYVLLGDGATLASGFSATADTARAHDGSPDAQGLGRFWILKQVSNHGEWLEVETVETVETTDDGVHHCAPALRGLDGYALRLYVRVDQTERVIRREVSITVEGGNRVTLSPGVRVVPPARKGEPTWVLVDPPLPLPVPADAIGRDYTTPIRYDQGESVGFVGPDALRLTHELELPEPLGWSVFARHDEGPLTVITVAEPCARYELRVPSAAVEEPQGQGGLGLRGTGRRALHVIAGGAPIYWANGERAGTTRYEVKRHDEPLRREVGRVCFAHSLTPTPQSADPVLVLCFDAPDVQSLASNEPAPPPARTDPASASSTLR